MKILKVDPGAKPKIMDINGELEAMQDLVGGIIQVLYPFQDQVALVCNDEGKLLGLPLNRALRDLESEEAYDVICGSFFLCGAPTNSDCFEDLTQAQLAHYTEYYNKPELFLETAQGIMVLKA